MYKMKGFRQVLSTTYVRWCEMNINTTAFEHCLMVSYEWIPDQILLATIRSWNVSFSEEQISVLKILSFSLILNCFSSFCLWKCMFCIVWCSFPNVCVLFNCLLLDYFQLIFAVLSGKNVITLTGGAKPWAGWWVMCSF